MTSMTEDEFNAVLSRIPPGANYFANANDVVGEDGKELWAVTEERIEDANGQVIALLSRPVPLYVDRGCPWKTTGLLGGRIEADYAARWLSGLPH